MERITTSMWRVVCALSLVLAAVSAMASAGEPRAAAALTAEAGRRLAEQTAESLAAAIDLYRQAFDLWREAGDVAAAAETGLALGKAYEQQGESQHAMVAYEEALAAARLAGQPRLEIQSLLGIGMALVAAGEGRRNARNARAGTRVAAPASSTGA